MKLSCTDAMVPGKTLTEKAKKLKKWGYEGVAVFMTYADWTEDKLEELLELEDKTGVKPCEFVFMDPVYGHLMDKDAGVQRKAIDMYKDTIRVSKKIGAITEMEYEYRTQNPLPLFDPYKKMPAEEEKEFLAVVRELGAEVEGSPALMLLEPCNRYETKYLTTLAACKRIIDKAKCGNLGVLADFFHMAIEEADLPQSIIDCGSSVRHVHLGDNNRLLPGYGHTDWKSGFKALKKIGFKGFMNLECGMPGKAETELPKVAEYLKGLIGKV